MLSLDSLFSLIAPHSCLVCNREGSLVCAWCRPDFAEPVPARCYRCFRYSPDSAVCAECRPHTRLDYVWTSTQYEGRPKELVRLLKFERAQAAVKIMAEIMASTLPYVAPDTLVVPVPTATSRIRQRGYDQAALLARELSRRLGTRYQVGLRRLGQNRQVGTNRQQRREQLSRAFQVHNPRSLQNATILLVDDVVTTGATLEAAASLLKRAGAKHVNAAVFAQTPLK